MKDTKAFYEERVRRLGFSTTEGLQPGQQSVTKMTITYQTAVFERAFELMHDCDTLLDVGCGGGEFLPFLRSRGWVGEYVGTDICQGFIDGCKKHYANDIAAGFVCGDFTDRRFRKELGKRKTVVSLSVFGLVDRASFMPELVEACFDSATNQYIFSCNSTHGYGKIVNKEAMLYQPNHVMDLVLGHTNRFSMQHYALGGDRSSIMVWSMTR